MSWLATSELPDDFPPFTTFRRRFGFVPNLFRAQAILPRLIEAEAGISEAALSDDGALDRRRKEMILLAVTADGGSTYCVTSHAKLLEELGAAGGQVDAILADHRDAGLSPADVQLIDFARKLARHPTRMGTPDFDALRGHGLDEGAILEAIVTTGLARFLCTISLGLAVGTDFPPRAIPAGRPEPPAERHPANGRPYVTSPAATTESIPAWTFFRERFGFVPRMFQAQGLRPRILEAQARAIDRILLDEEVLSRLRKERILLVVSAANLNTYCVSVHVEMLRNLGEPLELSDAIAVDHRNAGLAPEDVALLDFAVEAHGNPAGIGPGRVEALRKHGFSDPQILEALVMTGLTEFLNTVQMGLGVEPEFPATRVFEETLNPPPDETRQTGREAVHPDLPDGAPGDEWLVARVLEGETSAFEAIVRRHQTRLYRILLAVTGSAEDAEDALQNALLKGYRHLANFRGEARFSTWMTRIALNEGYEVVRTRRPHDTLFNDVVDDEGEPSAGPYEPWAEDPETSCSKSEMKAMVERAIMELSPIYRVALVMRDIEQMSTTEAAQALGIPVPALKSRLLRARLQLRDVLAPHFLRQGKEAPRV